MPCRWFHWIIGIFRQLFSYQLPPAMPRMIARCRKQTRNHNGDAYFAALHPTPNVPLLFLFTYTMRTKREQLLSGVTYLQQCGILLLHKKHMPLIAIQASLTAFKPFLVQPDLTAADGFFSFHHTLQGTIPWYPLLTGKNLLPVKHFAFHTACNLRQNRW